MTFEGNTIQPHVSLARCLSISIISKNSLLVLPNFCVKFPSILEKFSVDISSNISSVPFSLSPPSETQLQDVRPFDFAFKSHILFFFIFTPFFSILFLYFQMPFSSLLILSCICSHITFNPRMFVFFKVYMSLLKVPISSCLFHHPFTSSFGIFIIGMYYNLITATFGKSLSLLLLSVSIWIKFFCSFECHTFLLRPGYFV